MFCHYMQSCYERFHSLLVPTCKSISREHGQEVEMLSHRAHPLQLFQMMPNWFQSEHTNSDSHQQCIILLIAPHPWQCLLFFFFNMVGTKLCYITVLIYLAQIPSEIVLLFIFLLAVNLWHVYMPSKMFRICHPKICQFGIRDILS